MKRLILLAGLFACGIGPVSAATDFRCVNDCTRKGYMYQFCVQNCSYDSMPTPQYASPPQQKMLTPMDVMPSAQDRINIDQQIRETQRLQEELNATRLRNQQQQEEYKKRQRILDLQLEEAEAKAAERRQKALEGQEAEDPKKEN